MLKKLWVDVLMLMWLWIQYCALHFIVRPSTDRHYNMNIPNFKSPTVLKSPNTSKFSLFKILSHLKSKVFVKVSKIALKAQTQLCALTN